MSKEKKIVVISGPTASGKSDLGIFIGRKINGVVLNADSMQIYEGLPILSAHPSAGDLEMLEHRMYGALTPYSSNSVFNWLGMIKKNIDELHSAGKTPILVGGTGMYISRFIQGIKDFPSISEEIRFEVNELYENYGYDKFLELARDIDPDYVKTLNKNDRHRLVKILEISKATGNNYSYYKNKENETMYDSNSSIFHINMFPDREELYARCNLRFNLMVEKHNVVDECRVFLEKYPDVLKKDSIYSIKNTLGLKEIKDYLDGKNDLETTIEEATKITRHYAKRQFTWFRNQFKDVDFLLTEIVKKHNIDGILDNILLKLDK